MAIVGIYGRFQGGKQGHESLSLWPLLAYTALYPTFCTTSVDKSKLVGGFNPSEKYARQNAFIFPK